MFWGFLALYQECVECLAALGFLLPGALVDQELPAWYLDQSVSLSEDKGHRGPCSKGRLCFGRSGLGRPGAWDAADGQGTLCIWRAIPSEVVAVSHLGYGNT